MGETLFEQKIAKALGVKGGKGLLVEVRRVPNDGWVVCLEITLDEKQIARVKPIVEEMLQ